MVLAVTSSTDLSPTPAARAARVLELTARSWQLAPRSPQALARRAPLGYVPRRARLRAAALAALQGPVQLAHSW